MNRRDFIRLSGAVSVGTFVIPRAHASAPAATVLHDDRAVALTAVGKDRGKDPGKTADVLWIRTSDMPRINGFEIKPQGACRADVCIPVPKTMTRGQHFNLTAFAKKIGQAVVADPQAGVWSFGEIPTFRSGLLTSRVAPDFAVPDRKGRIVKLSSFRGKKVLVVTWASWCGCRDDLKGWQALYEELKGKNFEIIAAAEDTEGEKVTARWYDMARPTYTTLNDTTHAVSSAFQFLNVPSGAWIDENGRVVRPGEPAWTTNRKYNYGTKAVIAEGEVYVAALRDWVAKGDRSEFVLSDKAFAARVKPRAMSEMEAEAAFKLGVWLHQAGQADRAQVHFERAQQLDPDNWNYYRQVWAYTPKESGQKWMEKFQKLDEPYYPTLELKPEE